MTEPSNKRFRRMVRKICRKEARKQFKKFSHSVADLVGRPGGMSSSPHQPPPAQHPHPPQMDGINVDDLIQRIQAKMDINREFF